MLLLVRHAHAGDKRRWPGPDSLRPLSPAGQTEAAGLLLPLEDYPIGRILSSPAARCLPTVQPLADDRHLHVEPLPALGVDADLPVVLAHLVMAGLAVTSRWCGPRARPGCWTAPTDALGSAASCRHAHVPMR